MKRQAKEATAIGDLLAQILGNRPQYAKKSKQYALWAQWETIVGAQMAANATPLKMRDTTLILGAQSPAWVQELTYLRPQLLKKIHQVMDPSLITDIQVVLR